MSPASFASASYKKWITANPLEHIRPPKVKLSAPEIFRVDEADKLLKASAAHPELELLPFLSLALFSGIRVEELHRVDWSMINLSDSDICLSGERTKTYAPRNITMSKQLKAWLQTVKKTASVRATHLVDGACF